MPKVGRAFRPGQRRGSGGRAGEGPRKTRWKKPGFGVGGGGGGGPGILRRTPTDSVGRVLRGRSFLEVVAAVSGSGWI
jgi:hypothetical protein